MPVRSIKRDTHSTISRMTLARFALSSLHLRSSPAPDPPLSVVATLLVCVALPRLRPSVERRLTDSGREEGEPDDMDDTDISEGMRPGPPSTIVGRRDRV